MRLPEYSLSEIIHVLLDGWNNPKRYYADYDFYCQAYKERTGREVTVQEIHDMEKAYHFPQPAKRGQP